MRTLAKILQKSDPLLDYKAQYKNNVDKLCVDNKIIVSKYNINNICTKQYKHL